MAYSFTDKKRIRKNFGRRPTILEVPYLLAMQTDSYREFLQAEKNEDQRADSQLFRQCSAGICQLSTGDTGL